ncbi:dipeptide ABC transporter ATP-binding protein [Anaerobacillus alkaliphilus]|uniref:Dipeptide ABC transporter ATP-binding protein n=1 Tax=Anaerobacillus alkaliphilus TaxID=1548597 RepID=A0A4Q0VXG4_9BACI|nr:dipeptide ABC transporter ATP-binding protein [Anaerobacillus alkaliphilus]RXJ04219.1 dipeptide ABC transporter ATP-binding protein [Anaerobacillus alkaliphilus]
MNTPLLEIRNLKKHFPIRSGLLNRQTKYVKAVDGITFSVTEGETVGIVGESGCGKSTMGRTLLQLTTPTEGEVIFQGKNLIGVSPKELREMRKDMQMVFQDPYSSLNPRLNVFEILSEPLTTHGVRDKQKRKKLISEILHVVGLNETQMYRYPHEFSGGQRQRIGIARALILQPKLIVLDEPVSALDVSIQSQIINLLQDLQEEFGLTYLFISHDLSVVYQLCDKICVMYLGKIVEMGDVDLLYENPRHPYTKSLLSAVPVPDPLHKKERIILKGDVPNPASPPPGCAFAPRCPEVMDMCHKIKPELQNCSGVQVACHLYKDERVTVHV